MFFFGFDLREDIALDMAVFLCRITAAVLLVPLLLLLVVVVVVVVMMMFEVVS